MRNIRADKTAGHFPTEYIGRRHGAVGIARPLERTQTVDFRSGILNDGGTGPLRKRHIARKSLPVHLHHLGGSLRTGESRGHRNGDRVRIATFQIIGK